MSIATPLASMPAATMGSGPPPPGLGDLLFSRTVTAFNGMLEGAETALPACSFSGTTDFVG